MHLVFYEVYNSTDELKNDYNYIINVIDQNGLILSLVSDELKNNQDIVKKAISNNPSALIFASLYLFKFN